MASIGFGVVAAIALLSALLVVRSRNLVHAVLWLGVTLADTAVLYAMLGASFLAGVQVMLYVGGVVTLMIFGVMLTRRHDGLSVPAGSRMPGRGLVAAALLFGVLAAALTRGDLSSGSAAGAPAAAAPAASAPVGQAVTRSIGTELLSTHVLAFEVLSLLLLAAIVGAIVIARRRDHGAPATGARKATSS